MLNGIWSEKNCHKIWYYYDLDIYLYGLEMMGSDSIGVVISERCRCTENILILIVIHICLYPKILIHYNIFLNDWLFIYKWTARLKTNIMHKSIYFEFITLRCAFLLTNTRTIRNAYFYHNYIFFLFRWFSFSYMAYKTNICIRQLQ